MSHPLQRYRAARMGEPPAPVQALLASAQPTALAARAATLAPHINNSAE